MDGETYPLITNKESISLDSNGVKSGDSRAGKSGNRKGKVDNSSTHDDRLSN